MKPRHWAVLLAILSLTIVAGYFLLVQLLTVRYAGFQAAGLSSVWRGEGYETVKPDASLSSMVARAQWDHWVSPVPGLRGGIVFEEARSKGDEIYLLFRPTNVSDTMIVYCGDRPSRKLLWKMVLGFDA